MIYIVKMRESREKRKYSCEKLKAIFFIERAYRLPTEKFNFKFRLISSNRKTFSMEANKS